MAERRFHHFGIRVFYSGLCNQRYFFSLVRVEVLSGGLGQLGFSAVTAFVVLNDEARGVSTRFNHNQVHWR